MTGKEIRTLREGMNLGRTAFCALIDTPIETERKWETGHRVPNSENMAKLEKLKKEQGK